MFSGHGFYRAATLHARLRRRAVWWSLALAIPLAMGLYCYDANAPIGRTLKIGFHRLHTNSRMPMEIRRVLPWT
jgi:hypothetical protein